jgi:tetratricopeptide (TPR) repeat protein
MEEVAIKGFTQPIRVWRLMGLLSETSERESTPFVGRRSEVGQFASILASCLESGNGQIIYIRGEAGIGKTRLVAELRKLAERQGFACHSGLVLDFGVAKGQDAIQSIMRSLLNIPSGSNMAIHAAAADRVIAEGLLDPDARVYLNDLLGIPQPPELSAIYDTMDNATRNRGKRLTVVALTGRSSSTCPLVVVVENLHWADPLELTHLAALAGAVKDFPAVLLMTSRLEGDPVSQAWRSAVGNSPLITIDLAPLREAEALQLAAGFFDAGNRFALTCVERAGGNPLFLDQLLRTAQEIGGDEVPGSVQSLVQARVDRLEQADRIALQAASVIGQRFSQDAVRHLIESPKYACEKLLDNSLIRPEGEAFLFAHALVRDAVYSSLLSVRRRDLHRRAANWFRELDAALRALHLDRAEEPTAGEAYLEAARAEVEQFHFERAGALAKRGLEITRELATRHALTCLNGNILRELGENDKSIKAFEIALETSVDDAQRSTAWVGQAEGMRIADRFEDALAVLDKAQASASAIGRADHLTQIHFLRGNLYFPMGNMDGCLDQHKLALKFARDAASAEGEARALGGLGDAYYQRGRMITAYGHFHECVELSRKHGFGRIEVANLSMIGFSRRYAHGSKQALEIALETIEAAARVGHRRAELLGRLLAINVLVDAVDEDAARLHMHEADALVERSGARRFEPQILIHRAILLRTRGRFSEGQSLCTRAVAICRETGAGFLGAWASGELAANTEDPTGRRQALSDGESMLESGAVSHSHFHFYASAIEACLDSGEWDEVDRYATALEKFTQPEPLPWCDFHIARGRALARHGRGERDEATMRQLRRLRSEADNAGLRVALAAIEAALAGAVRGVRAGQAG